MDGGEEVGKIWSLMGPSEATKGTGIGILAATMIAMNGKFERVEIS